jgi:hypothetical protein
MFSVAKVTLWIPRLRGARVRASAQNGRTYAPDEREAAYRALLRDVILGSVAVILFSLAVPAWIIRNEYSKTYGTIRGLGSAPLADVLRERTLDTVVVTPRFPGVLELAEQIVRREAERRESERREAERRQIGRREATRRNATDSIADNTDVLVNHAAAKPGITVSPALNRSQSDFRESVQAP